MSVKSHTTSLVFSPALRVVPTVTFPGDAQVGAPCRPASIRRDPVCHFSAIV